MSLEKIYQKLLTERPDFFYTMPVPADAKGMSEDDALHFGLTRAQLRKLERQGRAIRGHTTNYWQSGDKHPHTGEEIPMGIGMYNGQEFEYLKQYRGQGHKTRWLLIEVK